MREKSPDVALISNFWIGKPEITQSAGQSQSEGIGFVELSLDKKRFKQLFSNLNSAATISGMTYYCYSTFAALDQITSKSETPLSAEQVYQALLKLDKINLLDEEISINNRFVNYDLVYKQIKDGRVVEAQ